jgi:hypothetical protein
MDAISVQPRNERVKNYIDFIHEKKIIKMKESLPLPKIKTATLSSPLSSPLASPVNSSFNVGVYVPNSKRSELEMLRKMESQTTSPA